MTFLVFKEREDHKGFVNPQRHSEYVGEDKGIALSKFENILDGQMVIITESNKLEIVKKDGILSVN